MDGRRRAIVGDDQTMVGMCRSDGKASLKIAEHDHSGQHGASLSSCGSGSRGKEPVRDGLTLHPAVGFRLEALGLLYKTI